MSENNLPIVNFLENNGLSGAEISHLAGDASHRRYARIKKDNKNFMLMIAPPEKEDVRPFIKIDELLRQCGLNAPEIIARDVEAGLLLLEDFGDELFSKVLREGRADENKLYHDAISLLRNLPEVTDLPEYSTQKLLDEVLLFIDWFAKDADREEYLEIWNELLAKLDNSQKILVLRDYHADNLMWLPERKGLQQIGLLDFQDAVMGNPMYDVVSLLEDARRDVDPSLRAEILAGLNPTQLRDYFILGAQRNLKIIGIFNRLKERDGKDGYLKFLPRVWAHLRNDLEYPVLAPLKSWMERNVRQDAAA